MPRIEALRATLTAVQMDHADAERRSHVGASLLASMVSSALALGTAVESGDSGLVWTAVTWAFFLGALGLGAASGAARMNARLLDCVGALRTLRLGAEISGSGTIDAADWRVAEVFAEWVLAGGGQIRVGRGPVTWEGLNSVALASTAMSLAAIVLERQGVLSARIAQE